MIALTLKTFTCYSRSRVRSRVAKQDKNTETIRIKIVNIIYTFITYLYDHDG